MALTALIREETKDPTLEVVRWENSWADGVWGNVFVKPQEPTKESQVQS